MFHKLRQMVKIVLVLFLILFLLGDYNVAVAVEETDGCQKALNNCMEQVGNLWDQVSFIPGTGTVYCYAGYAWCVLWVS